MQYKTYSLMLALLMCMDCTYMPGAQAVLPCALDIADDYTQQTIKTTVLIAVSMLAYTLLSSKHAQRVYGCFASLSDRFCSAMPCVIGCEPNKESIQQDVYNHVDNAQHYYADMATRIPLDLRAQALATLTGNAAALFAQWGFTQDEKEHNAYKQAFSMSADLGV